MCQFVLTIDDADVPTPARPIGAVLREIAAKIETQIPIVESGELFDVRNGRKLAAWTYGDEPEPPVL
jgi:hypothetical protein